MTDEHHRLLAEWAALCAEHVLHLFEQEQPRDTRPRDAIDIGRSWIRGEVRIHAKISTEVKPGILYTTFHFPEHLVNEVTSSECDEDTMYPEYKVVAVDVERVSAPVEKRSAQPETVSAK